MLILLNYKTCSGIQMSIDNDDESAWICRQLPPPSSSSSLLLPSSLLVNPAPNEPSMRHRALDWKWLENILNLTQHCGFNHPAVYQTFLPTFCVVNVVWQKFMNGGFSFFQFSRGNLAYLLQLKFLCSYDKNMKTGFFFFSPIFSG